MQKISIMKKVFLPVVVFISIFITKTNAQMADKDLTGEYYLQGVMEVGSGLWLKEDHTFEMFFSYGALDKSGNGTWKEEGNKIILNSGERPANDFKMVSSKKKGSGITIQVSDANTNILRYMASRISGKGFSDTIEANQEGMIHSDRKSADSIGLVHQMFSDRVCYFDVSKSEDNYFEFTIEKWILNIYCENLVLTIHDGYLEGKHPMLDPSKEYTFSKSE
jgi:hypothetical protein